MYSGGPLYMNEQRLRNKMTRRDHRITELIRLARILKRVLESHWDSIEIQPADAYVKVLQGVERLYVSRKEWGRGLASIENNVDTSIEWLEVYIEKHVGKMITDIRNEIDYTT